MTEARKAAKGNWDEDFNDNDENKESPEGDRRKTNYADLSKPGKYVIRLVGDHVRFRKRFAPYKATLQEDELDIDLAYVEGWYFPKKYAVNIINKTGLKEGEVGKHEVLEKGPSVFKNFANYKSVFGVDPAGKKGPDFLIDVKIPKGDDGKPNKLKTEYTVTHIKEAPFTPEEIAMIKEGGGLYDLSGIYRSTSSEKIQEMWESLSPEQRKAPKSKFSKSDKQDKQDESNKVEASVPDSIEEPMTDNAPADSGEDLFGDSPSDESTSAELF
jgi:hypothetical protein